MVQLHCTALAKEQDEADKNFLTVLRDQLSRCNQNKKTVLPHISYLMCSSLLLLTTSSQLVASFSQYHKKTLMDLIILEMHGLCHQLPIVGENATKPTVQREFGKLVSYLSHSLGAFTIQFSSYGTLQHMGNALVFLLISQNAEKYNKTHCEERNWEIGTHTFPIVWMVFPIRFPSYCILHPMGNAWVFSSDSHSMGNSSKTH